MTLSKEKRQTQHLGQNKPTHWYRLGRDLLSRRAAEKDLGVTVHLRLKKMSHRYEKGKEPVYKGRRSKQAAIPL